jgi:hypothetical protein
VSADDEHSAYMDGSPRPVRVQAVFHVSSDEQAQAVAARMVDRAQEIANLPECECDVDVSVERARVDATSMVEPSAVSAREHPVKL